MIPVRHRAARGVASLVLCAAFPALVLAAASGVHPRAETDPGGGTDRARGPEPANVRVMSFNIRYGTAEDGDDAWPLRRDLVAETIHDFAPDLVGLQEALRFQLDELGRELPGYHEVGAGRDDGREAGEYAAILFRAERFALTGSGTFWLSDTPGTPGSADWGNRIPRICTWATLRDGRSGGEILVLDAHLDHESPASRERSVALIAARTNELRDGREVILMGDFNTPPSSAPMAWLRGERSVPWASGHPPAGKEEPALAPPRLRDSFALAHPDSVDPGTFHGFTGTATGGRIDAILVSDGWEVREAEVLRVSMADRYPSDHFPVTAVLRLHR